MVFCHLVLVVPSVCEKKSWCERMPAPVQPCSLRVSTWCQQYPADRGSILQGAVMIPICTAVLQESSQRTTRCFFQPAEPKGLEKAYGMFQNICGMHVQLCFYEVKVTHALY